MQCTQNFIFNANFVETIFPKISKAPIHIATNSRSSSKARTHAYSVIEYSMPRLLSSTTSEENVR